MRKLILLLLSLSFFYVACSQKSRNVSKNTLPKELKEYSWGYNAQLMRGVSWSSEGFADAVKKLNPFCLRYPGGTNSNYWNWQTGWIKTDIAIRKEWKNIPENKSTLEDFAKVIAGTNAKPVFVVNMLTSTLEEQLAMLQRATELNLPVELIELGNEFYLPDADNVKQFATAYEYAAMCNQYITAIRKKFPVAKIGVVANSLRDVQLQGKEIDERGLQWNDIIYKEVKAADAFTFHVYAGTGLAQVNTNTEKVKHTQKSDYTKAEQEVWQEAFEKPEAINRIFSVALLRAQMFAKNDAAKVPAGKAIWVTEYNLFENEGVVAGTWAHGLYAAILGLELLNNSKTEMVCLHNLAQTAQFGAMFYDEQGFKGNYKETETEKFSFSATGTALNLISDALQNMKTIEKIKLSNVNSIMFGNKKIDGVYVYKLLGENNSVRQNGLPITIGTSFSGEKIIVVNLTDKPYSLDLPELKNKKTKLISRSADIRKQIAKSGDVLEIEMEISESAVTVQIYSVNMIY